MRNKSISNLNALAPNTIILINDDSTEQVIVLSVTMQKKIFYKITK
jgi:hypothetical protein